MLSAQKQNRLIERKCAQRFKLLDKLQEVNKENAILRKQLAKSVASVASMANVASYRLRGIEPKN